MKNLIRKILKEVISDTEDSYLRMNIKNFGKYIEDLTKIFEPQLKNSNGDFVKFKKSVLKSVDYFGKVELQDNIKINHDYLNFLQGFGKQKFASILKKIFNKYYNITTEPTKPTGKVNCNLTKVDILGPIIAKDEKMLLSHGIGEAGGKVYRVRLPDDCMNQLIGDERNIYVTMEPTENRIHFPKGVPERLRGKGLGTLIYLTMIKKVGYITSSMGNSPEIKMVYQDLISNPKYEKDIMTLLLQKQILIFDRNTNLNVKKIFNEFVKNKYTDKKSVRISPTLEKMLGSDYQKWYQSLGDENQENIQAKINKYKNLEPKGGDTVYDTKTKKVWSLNGTWKDKGKELMHLINSEYETLILPTTDKKRFKVISRQFN